MTSRLPIWRLSFSAFVLVLGLLALQLREGRDPALGDAKAPTPAPRRVLVRRVVRRVVIVRVIPADAAGPAPVTSAPTAVAASPPAPIAAAAAPAPVTRSS